MDGNVQFNTLDVILSAFETVTNDPGKLGKMAGCDDDSLMPEKALERMITASDNVDVEVYVPRVFDLLLFNNEISLLQLRLRYLESVVDKHIIVEAPITFTGKPKPLYFHENRHLFEKYAHRIEHVVVPQLPGSTEDGSPMKTSDVWLNEYYSRNYGAVGLTRVGARDEDVIVLSDVDEIPHPRAVQTLRALFTTDDGRTRVRTPLIYKLYARTYMYDFNCSLVGEKALAGGAATATSLGTAKALQKGYRAVSGDNYITLARMHQQYINPYPYQNVLYPGGWHLTFFGGVAMIKSKLAAYSHQNFVRQFMRAGGGNCSHETGVGREQCLSGGKPVYDPEGREIFPETIATGDILEEKIRERLQQGEEIDNRKGRRCRAEEVRDPETAALSLLWEETLEVAGTSRVSAASPSPPGSVRPEHVAVDAVVESETSIAIISGYIGVLPTFVPGRISGPGIDCFFITNNNELAAAVPDSGWTSLLVDVPLVNSSESTENAVFNSFMSKSLKVYPQTYLTKSYDFIVWFDNKYDLRADKVLAVIKHWNTSVAMMLHRVYMGCCGAESEFRKSINQPRYAVNQQAMSRYIEEEVAEGYDKSGRVVTYNTGFIIYNMHHPDTHKIQALWASHINRCGIMCQISFHFVAQRFPVSIQEYVGDWGNRRLVFISQIS